MGIVGLIITSKIDLKVTVDGPILHRKVRPEKVEGKNVTLTLVTCTPIRITTHRLISNEKLKNN